MRPTPEEFKKDNITSLIKEILRSDYTPLSVDSIEIKEERSSKTKVKIWLLPHSGKRRKQLTSEGAGMVDALFKALKGHFSKEFHSLAKIGLSSFTVLADNYSSQTPEGTDALVKVKICFRDAYGKIVPFVGTSRSLSKAVAASLVCAFEYYINSEKCFLKLRQLVHDAESRSRGDLRDVYVSQLVRIVGVSSYEEISV